MRTSTPPVAETIDGRNGYTITVVPDPILRFHFEAAIWKGDPGGDTVKGLDFAPNGVVPALTTDQLRALIDKVRALPAV